MPVADSEIVFGAYTEYTGLRFAFFLLAEYAGIVVMSLLFAVLYLGGWHGPFERPLGWVWTVLKGVPHRGRRHLAARRLAAAARGPAAAAGLARGSCRSPSPSWCSPASVVVIACQSSPANTGTTPATTRAGVPGASLKGLATTARTRCEAHPHRRVPRRRSRDLPPRSRGVIALLEENCTSCMLCARECPDWCIYIDSHKETIPATTPGGRDRQRNVLDRFAIDFSLCMYCGICIEVCPFDALHWSPEFEYAELDIRDLLHEKDRLGAVDAHRPAAARARRALGRAGRDRRGQHRPARSACRARGAVTAGAAAPRHRAAPAPTTGRRPRPSPRRRAEPAGDEP